MIHFPCTTYPPVSTESGRAIFKMDNEANRTKRGAQPDELVTIAKAYDLIRELTQRVSKFPRDYKFLLGNRILNIVYDVLDLLLEAKFTRDKVSLLDRANLRLEQMRFQVRLAHDDKLMSTHQYEVRITSGARIVTTTIQTTVTTTTVFALPALPLAGIRRSTERWSEQGESRPVPGRKAIYSKREDGW